MSEYYSPEQPYRISEIATGRMDTAEYDVVPHLKISPELPAPPQRITRRPVFIAPPQEVEIFDDPFQDLPIAASLPPARVLDEGYRKYSNTPIVLEKPVTLGDLQSHLAGTTPWSREIGIDSFADGTDVMIIGTNESVNIPKSWKPFFVKADVTMHTHPDPRDTAGLRWPSLSDLDHAAYYGRSELVASAHGMTLYESPSTDIRDVWNRYAKYTRGFTKESYDAYKAAEGKDPYVEFLSEVIGPVHLGWTALGSDMSLRDARDYLQSIRR